MTEEQKIEDLFRKADKALKAKIKDENSSDDPRIYLDELTEIFLERQMKELEAKNK